MSARPSRRVPAGGRQLSPGQRLRRLFSRVGSHIFRPVAGWGWFVAAVSIALYALLPVAAPGLFGLDAFRQFFLILASVAVGFVLLPELPSNLWSLDENRVRNLIPEYQRDNLSRALIGAETDDRAWSDAVWADALEPLKLAARDPWRYVVDMDYEATIYLGQTVDGPQGIIPVSRLSVEQKSKRVLGRRGAHEIWISIVRTEAALDSEFAQAGCLAREFVPLVGVDAADWQRLVRDEVRVVMLVEGRPVELTPHLDPDELPNVVRYKAVGFQPGEKRQNLRIAIDAPMDPDERTFPVKFKGYYCAGSTQITMRIYPGDEAVELAGTYFVGRALEADSPPDPIETRTELYQVITFSTGGSGILWPGSGVLFSWDRVR